MTLAELLGDKRAEILRIAARHGATNVRVFGSVVRGEAGPGSDIDFLVDAGPGRSAFFPAGLLADLEDLLGCKVDVVTEASVSPYIRPQVLRDAVAL